jgi:hypothetical protein
MAAGETVMTFKGVGVGLKICAHKLRVVIVARGDASRDGFAEATEPFLHRLPHELENFQPRAAFVAHHDFLDSFLNYCHAAGSSASRA